MPQRPNTEADFWERVDKFGPLPEARPELGNCWLWTGTKDQSGYGLFKLAGVQWRCGRLALAFTTNEPAPELFASPLCKNPACVRPSHLEVVTPKQCVLRGDSIQAQNARKTHCKNNHPLPEPNEQGVRRCPICAEQWHRRNSARGNREGENHLQQPVQS